MNKMRIGKLIYILAILTGNLAAAASGQDAALFSFSQSPVHSEGNYFEDLFDFDDPYNDEVYDYEQDFFGGLMRQEEPNNSVSSDNIYGSEFESLDASRDRGPEIRFVDNLFGTEGLPTSIPVMDALQPLESTSRDDGKASQELFVFTQREKRGRGGEKRFKCTHEGCLYATKIKSHLNDHMRTHTEERPYACTHEGCSYAAKSKSTLKDHMRRKHTDERPYVCTREGCLYAAKSKSELKNHVYTHTGQRPYACTQAGCSHAAITQSNLNSHIMRRHSEERGLFACESGMRTLTPIIEALQAQIELSLNSSLMRLGESVDHNQPTEQESASSLVGGDRNSESDLSCANKKGEAENRSLDKNEDVLAVQTFENGNEGMAPGEPTVNNQREKPSREREKRFECTQGCGYVAKYKAFLDMHMRKHTGERSYPCTQKGCSYAAKLKSNLRSHMLTHTEERSYACTQEGCSYVAKRKCDLTRHMLTHIEERLYVCTHGGCLYAAKSKSEFNRHNKIHTGERPYPCTQEGCSYAAISKSILKNHVRTHTGEKPFKCTYEGCVYAAARASHLSRHTQTHTKEKFPKKQCIRTPSNEEHEDNDLPEAE